MMVDIGILSVGFGNVNSIVNMISKFNASWMIVVNPDDLVKCRKIIIPGVGNFSNAVVSLKKTGMFEGLQKIVSHRDVNVLGICLGMQLLCNYSEEGSVEGIGLVDAVVKKFELSEQLPLKVPHMGWNTLRTIRENPLLPMDEEERRFYFVHSYKVVPNNPDISIGQCDYGGEFCAAFQHDNIFGVQFHPEKSHRFGIALMKRFVEL